MTGILNLLVGMRRKRVANVQVTNGSFYSLSAGTSGFRVDSDGTVYTTNSAGTYVSNYVWNTLSDSAANFDVKITITGGSPGSFTTAAAVSGAWINLASDRTWTLDSGTVNVPQTVTYTIEIRDANTLESLGNSTGTLTAERYI